MAFFDFNAIATATACETGKPVTITNIVTGLPIQLEDGSEVSITMTGPEAHRYRAAQAAFARSARDRAKDISEEDKREANLVDTRRFIASLIIGWHGIGLDGQELEFTVENAELLMSRCPNIHEQLDTSVADRVSFLAPAVTMSSALQPGTSS